MVTVSPLTWIKLLDQTPFDNLYRNVEVRRNTNDKIETMGKIEDRVSTSY